MKTWVLLLSMWSVMVEGSVSIKVVTEEAPPMHYKKNGNVVGGAADVVQAVLKRAKLPYKIKVLPWGRAYDMALNEKNVLIFMISRTPKRESLFKWAGELLTIKYFLFKIKDRKEIVINSLEDAKKYKLGAVIDDVRTNWFKDQNFQRIDLVKKNAQNITKLLLKRVDIIPNSDLGVVSLCKKENLDCSKLEKAFFLEDLSKNSLYMAFSKKTSDEIVNNMKQALSKIKEEGIYDKIMSPYLDIK